MPKRHLALVGLMGAGKTSVGREVARTLDRRFVDTDGVVEALAHRSVAAIFEQEGEARFRELERDAVADVCASPEPLVIACGGGAVLDAGARRRLRETAHVVWLQAPPSVLSDRVGGGDTRPLLRGDGIATLERLASLRAAAYEAAADVAVDTAGRTVDEVAAVVVEEWRACSG
jgi:shikimate kinase